MDVLLAKYCISGHTCIYYFPECTVCVFFISCQLQSLLVQHSTHTETERTELRLTERGLQFEELECPLAVIVFFTLSLARTPTIQPSSIYIPTGNQCFVGVSEPRQYSNLLVRIADPLAFTVPDNMCSGSSFFICEPQSRTNVQSRSLWTFPISCSLSPASQP